MQKAYLTYLLCIIQDDNSIPNGNRDLPAFDGMADAEVERRLKVVYQDLLFAQAFGIINTNLLNYLVVQLM